MLRADAHHPLAARQRLEAGVTAPAGGKRVVVRVGLEPTTFRSGSIFLGPLKCLAQLPPRSPTLS